MIDFSGIFIAPQEVLDFLRRDTSLKPVCEKILHQKIIEKAAQERDIFVSSEEVQAEADRLRFEMHLERASDTLNWLADQLMTSDIWEMGIRDRLLAKKLSESLFSSEVGRYFAQNRLDFEKVLLYKITVPYQQLAQELFYQIEESEISFYEAAHLYDIDERRRLQCGYEGKLQRWSLKPDVAAIIFSSTIATLIGPLQSEQGYDLLIVEEFIEAELTPEVYQKILDDMFIAWLSQERNYLIHSESPNAFPNHIIEGNINHDSSK